MIRTAGWVAVYRDLARGPNRKKFEPCRLLPCPFVLGVSNERRPS
ncbi:hypothetical protein SAMN02990966_03669 [Rhodospirillales bacterium URHD0017]|nr:hypothetical protein SAMN02990966_03669 [Rhodospirillales bacterium URHD0017]